MQLHALRVSREQREQDLRSVREAASAAEDAYKAASSDFKRAKETAAENHPLTDADK